MLKKGDIVEIVDCKEAILHEGELWLVVCETTEKGWYIRSLKSLSIDTYSEENLKVRNGDMDVHLKFDTTILTQAIIHYEKCSQYFMVLEELSELQKAVCKGVRGEDCTDDIKEEIADVLIMIEQLKIMEGISSNEVQEIIDYKTSRLKERMREERECNGK